MTAPTGVPIEAYELHDVDTGQTWHWEKATTRDLVTEVEEHTGMTLTSYNGTCSAYGFKLESTCDEPVETSLPDCDEEGITHGPADPAPVQALCPAETGESLWCLGLRYGGGVEVVGLDSGNICYLMGSTMELGTDLTSFAWLDHYVYACTEPFHVLERLDLTTGDVDQSFTYCSAVTAYDQGLLTRPIEEVTPNYEDQLYSYPTYRDAECRNHALHVISDAEGSIVGIDTHDHVLYGIHHGLNNHWVSQFSMPTGESQGYTVLDTVAAGIGGLSIVGDDYLVANLSGTENRVAVFDLATGMELWSVGVSQTLLGLECWQGS